MTQTQRLTVKGKSAFDKLKNGLDREGVKYTVEISLPFYHIYTE